MSGVSAHLKQQVLGADARYWRRGKLLIVKLGNGELLVFEGVLCSLLALALAVRLLSHGWTDTGAQLTIHAP